MALLATGSSSKGSTIAYRSFGEVRFSDRWCQAIYTSFDQHFDRKTFGDRSISDVPLSFYLYVLYLLVPHSAPAMIIVLTFPKRREVVG